jgi:hypothetical protein
LEPQWIRISILVSPPAVDDSTDRVYSSRFAGAHLSHHPRAVQLDRLFNDSEMPCNLLIEPTRDYMSENLFFAGRQASNPIIY